ncbi:MAG: amidophosphoribosyltransferase [Candidatus Taylorbacteria bacterium]|nr:amidophosphoribosyltransferase [Candidatus Taylorbacteria bacterium]
MCAIIGVFNAHKAAELTLIGLHLNQHRATDYAGIASTDGKNLFREQGKGIARNVFMTEMLDRLHGQSAIGHIRYPTVGDDPTRNNIQPISGRYGGRDIAIAHNGNITNISELKTLVPGPMATSMDTEYILRLLEAKFTGDIINDLVAVMRLLKGSCSLLVMTPDKLIAARDASGNRPLSIGQAGDSFFASSEDCAFPNLGATHLRDVESGMIVWFDERGMHERRFAEADEHRCVFEHVYYAHPASRVFGLPNDEYRYRVGQELERLFPVKADYVTPIPDSSNFYAKGFAASGRSGKDWQLIFRSHYGSRSFIKPTQALRDTEVRLKFTFIASKIRGSRIVVIDDSIVRNTTLPKIVQMCRSIGALEVHARIAYPPFRRRCIYGLHTPTDAELIASHCSVEEIRKQANADTLEFLPYEVLRDLLPDPKHNCFACADGKYW